MIPVTLRQLEYFLAVVEAGSISGAADECHISAAGISQALNELEKAMGVQLTLRRKGQGVVPTAAGIVVAEKSRVLVGQAQDLLNTADELQGRITGTLRIGCFSTLSPWMAPRIIEYFNTSHPALHVELVEGSAVAVQELLAAGRIDVALMFSTHLDDGVDHVAVARVRPHLLLPRGHRLAGRECIYFRELGDEPVALLDLKPTSDLIEAMMASAGATPNIRWRSAQIETIRSIVGRGLAYSVLIGRPTGTRTHDGLDLVYKPIADDIPENAITVAYPRGALLTRKVQTLIDYCTAEFVQL